MKVLLILIIIVHGLIHLIGFIKERSIAPVSLLSGASAAPLTRSAAHTAGLVWLAVCLLFLYTAAAYFLGNQWWWIPALMAVIVSQALIIIYWDDAKWGTVANIILLSAAVISYAEWRFDETVQDEVAQLFTADTKYNDVVITEGMVNGLPYPVRLWLKHSGIIGKQQIFAVRLKQKGFMRTKPGQERWVEARAEQYFTVSQPAFIWKVRMNMIPLVPITGWDKWVNGKGRMNIRLLSLISIVNNADDKIDQGALQRYLAETCWFPGAALSPFIQWEAVDSTSARATMTYKGVSGCVQFFFNENGDVTGCMANRYMGGGKESVLEKWHVQSAAYGVMDGIRVPVRSEATWKLKNGDFTWYKLEITELQYNRPALY